MRTPASLGPLRPLVSSVLALSLVGFAAAQADTDLTTPTGWWYHTSASLQDVDARINQGFRLVDIEVLGTNPLSFAASYVQNTGAYAKGWWWYFDQTSASVTSLLTQNNARLIDIEPYDTASGLRYAAVMIANTGNDFASAHGWQTAFTATGVSQWINSNPTRRIIDIQPYTVGSEERYAFVWVNNSGSLQSPWWILLNATQTQVSDVINQNQARLIDLERQPGTRFSAVFTPAGGRTWYYLYQITSGELARLTGQFASRIIDIERNSTLLGTRYDVVLLQNDNDLAIDTNIAMRDQLPLGASSGFLLRQLGSTTNTLAGVFEDETFEPASLMKTAHHFTAMRRVSQGFDSLSNSLTEFAGLNGSCPTGSNPSTRILSNVLRDMMESSSNTATEAIRARYGSATILATCAAFGANGLALNHTLGCLCGLPRNEARLDDFAAIHNAVVNGNLGTQRANFYDLMSNGQNFGMGTSSTLTTLNQELAASSLSSLERQAFTAGLAFAHKGGSYTCNAGPEHHRSRGAYVRIPFRSGCNTIFREYFIGAWVNDAVTGSSADNAVGIGLTSLYRDVLRDAIASWESASCTATAAYCSAAVNSTGTVGLCSSTGSTYIVANDLVLRASNLPLQSFGYLLVSESSGFVANPGGSAGNLCLGGAVGRYSNFVASTGSTGTLSRPFNVNSYPSPSGPVGPVQPGMSLYFQWWHRDSSATGTSTSNFTRGLRVTFI